MNGIREFLERRRDEARKEMAPLEANAADLRAKLGAVDTKLRVFTKELADIEKALQALGKKEKSETTVTIKEAILQVLGDAPNGLTSPEILEAINDRFFEGTLPRTSMSPQLTRLKNDNHKIKARGDKYYLA
jgi:uncharacterized coiled-coil DUF342 family protein